jgi:hypothetical protein
MPACSVYASDKRSRFNTSPLSDPVAQVLAIATSSALTYDEDLLLKPLAFGDVHAPLSPSSARQSVAIL